MSPDGSVLHTAPGQVAVNAEPALLKALGEHSRGTYTTVFDIARAEKLDRTYVGDVLRSTLLAPEIVEAIVEVRQEEGMTQAFLLRVLPPNWVRHCNIAVA